MQPGGGYRLIHTTRDVKAFVSKLLYRVDVDTLHREHADTLGLNDIGRVEITTAQPLFFDSYQLNQATGGFILVDEATNATVAAGMIRGGVRTADELYREGEDTHSPVSPDVVWQEQNLLLEALEGQTGHPAWILWFTGLSGAGKSTIARALQQELLRLRCRTMLLDGDQLRHGLCGDLGFSARDRKENLRRAGEVARLFFHQGFVVLCTFISPFARDRARLRKHFPGRFLEIYVECPLEQCERRDPKGLYAKAREGLIPDFTGISSPYEPPERPEMVIETEREPPEEAAARILERLRQEGRLPG